MAAQPLGPEQAGRVYDRIGRLQDWQRFYEGPAVRDLEAYAGFNTAHSVFELGCGTGALAQRLLGRMLPADAQYVGVDVSTTMVGLTTNRIRSFGPRASVQQVSGWPPLPGTDGTFDRFVAVYVFDLLPAELAAAMLAEAARLLTPGGLVCLVSLAEGETLASRALCTIWNRAWQLSPALVGGCRPVGLVPLLTDRWRVDHFATLTTWAVTSQVLVASPVASDQRFQSRRPEVLEQGSSDPGPEPRTG